MITPREVFRYSAAATAGFILTGPAINWLLSIAQTLAIVAALSFILAVLCIVEWIATPDRWLLIYFGVCLVFLFGSAVPLTFIIRLFCRYFEEEKSDGCAWDVQQPVQRIQRNSHQRFNNRR